MSNSLVCLSEAGREPNGGLLEDVENAKLQSLSSPSSSSSSSSSSWHKSCDSVHGINSRSDASVERPMTKLNKELKDVIVESTLCLGTSLVAGPESLLKETKPQHGRQSGRYQHQNTDENAKLQKERINIVSTHHSPSSLFSSFPAHSTPFPSASGVSSYLDKVIQETVDTEEIYVKDLKDIVRGYLKPLRECVEITIPQEDLHAIFGNIKNICKFNRSFFESLRKCGRDAVKIGVCFTGQSGGFTVYDDYCTNYPRSLEAISRYTKDPQFFATVKRLQAALKHALPLQTYLFKPVQRILKYHLLLKNIVTHHDESLPGHDIIVEAYNCMMDVADHLNKLMRNQERRAEVQKLILASSGTNLSHFGDLILEDKFSLSGVRDVYWAFLFQNGLLLAKKRKDDQLQLKTTIMCSNLTLVERVPKEPLSFQVLPYDSPKMQLTLQARTQEQKQLWCQKIKTLMLDSYKVAIPEKARQLLMCTGRSQENDQYNVGISMHRRRRSVAFISDRSGENLGNNDAVVPSSLMEKRSENLSTEGTNVNRSRPIIVDSGVNRRLSERRSQSLDSLHSVLLEPDTVPELINYKSENKRNARLHREQATEMEEGKQGRVEFEFHKVGARKVEINSVVDYMTSQERKTDSLKGVKHQKKNKSKFPEQNPITSKEGIERKSTCGEETYKQPFIKMENPKVNKGSSMLLENANKSVSNKPTVTRSAAMRASSFQKAVEQRRIDSVAVKRSNIKVRRKPSEDPQEGEANDSATSDSSNECLQISLPPIVDPSVDLTVQTPSDDIEEELYRRTDDILENEMQLAEKLGQNNDSQCSDFSFLSTALESLSLSDASLDVTRKTFEKYISNDESSLQTLLKNTDYSKLLVDAITTKVDIYGESAVSELADESHVDTNSVRSSDLELINCTNKQGPISDSLALGDNLLSSDESQLNTITCVEADTSLFESLGSNIEPVDPIHACKGTADVNLVPIPRHLMLQRDVGVNLKRKRSSYEIAASERSEAVIRRCYSLPCLSSRTSYNAPLGTMHQYEMQEYDRCSAVGHSRGMSLSDLAGYFSNSTVSAVLGMYMSSSDSLDSVKNQCNRNPKVESSSEVRAEDHSSAGNSMQQENNSFKESVSCEDRANEGMIDNDEADNDNVTVDVRSGSCESKIKNRSKLHIETIPITSFNPPIASDENLDSVIVKRPTKSEPGVSPTKVSTRKYAAESIVDTRWDPIARAPSIDLPSFAEELSESSPVKEFLNCRNSKIEQRTYVYRLARAYSSRVKQLQKEAVISTKVSETKLRRSSIIKWSVAEESSPGIKERCSSLGDIVLRNSHLSKTLPQRSFHPTTDGSSLSISSGSYCNTSETCLKSYVETDCPDAGTVSHRKSWTMMTGKQYFGLSLDSFPEFSLDKSDDDCHSDDCFDNESGSKGLVKQRVRLFEGCK